MTSPAISITALRPCLTELFAIHSPFYGSNTKKPVLYMYLKCRKLLKALANPVYWRGLKYGVAPTIEHDAALAGLRVNTVIDVGANKGQFSLLTKRLFPTARICAFEPLPRPAQIFRRVF